MFGGVVSSGNVPFQLRSLVILAVVWLVSEPLLGSLLAFAVEIARVRCASRAEAPAPPGWRIPYVQPASPGGRTLDRLADLVASFAADWRALGGAGARWVLLALITAVLGTVAGGWVPLLVLLSLVALACVAAGKPLRSDAREALSAGQIFVAWLVGRSAFFEPDWQALLIAAAFAAIWYAWTRRPPLAELMAATHVLLAGLLAAAHAPLSAGGVLLLAVPLFVLRPESPSTQRTYLPQTQHFLMASLLLAAWGLVWSF